MRRQFRHDCTLAFYTLNYRLLFLMVILLTSFLTFYGATTGNRMTHLMQHFSQFRPFFWLICAYLIADIFARDYRARTISIIIPKLEKRWHYILSKFLTSQLLCFAVLLSHLGTIWVILNSLSTVTEPVTFFSWSYFIPSLAISIGFLSLLIGFLMIRFERELVATSTSFGLIFFLLTIDSIDVISPYLPTTQPLMLETSMVSTPLLSVASLSSYFVLSLLLFLGTIIVFKQKDLN